MVIFYIWKRHFTFQNFARNLIYASRLVPLGYSFNFSEVSFSLFFKSYFVGSGILSDGLFQINLQHDAMFKIMLVLKDVL